jgi:anti-sigma factor RsiW
LESGIGVSDPGQEVGPGDTGKEPDVKSNHEPLNGELRCENCRPWLQDYLDGTLPKAQSLALFLHVRQCAACHEELEAWRELFQDLNQLTPAEVPSEFDQRVLAEVPYAAYRQMEPLRRDRVPVVLQEDFLPSFLRARPLRIGGLTLAGLAGVGLATGVGPAPWETVALAGALPQILVSLQSWGRKLALTEQRSET